jgi:hypothetical protein
MEWFNPIEWLAWLYGKLFQGHPYFGGVVVCTCGALLFLGLYVKAVDKFKEDSQGKAVPTATSVTLQFNQEDSTPVIIESKNMRRTTWFDYNFREKETQKILGKSWAVFLVFEKPVPVRQVKIDGHGQQLPSYNIVDLNSASVVVVFGDDITNKSVTIAVEN